MMPFRPRYPHRNSTKNIVETVGNLIAATPAVSLQLSDAVDSAALANANEVERGSAINALYLQLFIYLQAAPAAAGAVADWYIIKDPGGIMANAGFVADGLPTPGVTGTHENKRFIIHEEKGLPGNEDGGIPLYFKGLIMIPKHMRTQRSGDNFLLVTESQEAGRFCIKCIYKWHK